MRARSRPGRGIAPARSLGFLLLLAGLVWLVARAERPLSALVIAGATWTLGCCLQASLHLWLGHHRRGRGLWRTHVRCHHTIYSGRRFLSDTYEDPAGDLDAFYVLPMSVAAFLLWRLLPAELFQVHAVTFALVFLAHVVTHEHLHVRRSPLVRFHWFRRLRRHHAVHHRSPRHNVAALQTTWDRVLGTYRTPR